MHPSPTPLVPDDQYHDHDFVPRDLDAERDLNDPRRRRPPARQSTTRPNTIRRPSVANRTIRSVSRFLAALLIGVGLTLAWQSYPEQVSEVVASWAPGLVWLFPAPSPKKSAEAAMSSEMAQQIKLIAVDLAIVRRNIGQLTTNQDQFAAKQQQMSESIANLQQVEQDVRQQVLSPPAPKAAHPPAHNPLPTSPR
jgi:hypothetical protein